MAALLTLLCLTALCWGALGQERNDTIPTRAMFDQVAMPAMFTDIISARTASELNAVYMPVDNGTSRFDNSMSSGIRRNYYFNCVEKDENGTVTFPTREQLMNNMFSVYFQMPVLLYLNFEVRVGMMAALRNVTGSSELCIYQHQDFRVSYFEEGVLVSFFDRATAMSGGSLNGAELLNRFMNRPMNMDGWTTFLGKRALNLGYSGLYPNNIVPAVVAPRTGDNAGFPVDPSEVRRHALTILSWVGTPNLADVASTILSNTATNPNPINFYLEAGDYVFIVIGSILTFSVLVLTVVGFAIHPYFLG